MNLAAVAEDTLAVVRAGRYTTSRGEVEIGAAIAHARDGTRVYLPGDYERLAGARGTVGAPPAFDVVGVSTAVAARR